MKPSQTPAFHLRAIALGTGIALLAGCATAPTASMRRDADLRQGAEAGTSSADTASATGARTQPLLGDDERPQPQIRRGSGTVLNQRAASAAPPTLGATSGQASFNFEGESVHAVAKAILGDMLGQNYVIAPEVQGTVTLATPQPVSAAQALSLLEMVLGWNNARMIYSDGRYNIVAADTALATGTVAPRTGSTGAARGFEVRTVPLRYISATEMEKVLEPYARPNAIVSADNARNVITISGSRSELDNYLRTIEIFDVDWLSGMSVGVFPLQSGKATQVVADLEKVFGQDSESPVSGMFRFMPLEGANAVLVITPQADYLGEIQQWLERIDNAGQDPKLFSYELKFIKARELAQRLSEVFGGGSGSSGGQDAASLMPGLTGNTLRTGGTDGSSGLDSGSSSSSGLGSNNRGGTSGVGRGGNRGGSSGGDGGQLQLSEQQDGPSSVTLEVEGDRVGVSAVDETNTLLVRTTPAAWRSIRDVVERLDVMPAQVHIEAQVVEVLLTGDLSYGVNWFIEKGLSDNQIGPFPGLDPTPGVGGPSRWSTLGASIGGVSGPGLAWSLVKNDAAAIINALDQVTDVQVLQSPSVFVRNNAMAEFNVGASIPIASSSVNPILGDSQYTQVQYIETGTILKVRPRVTRDGMVFLDIVQEVSTPGAQNTADAQGNVRIDTRRLKTEAAVQAGDTVMLAGLIRDQVSRTSSGLPGLSRIPVIGGLFGSQGSGTERSEVIVLLTPTIVRNPLEARQLTDEYGRRFRALQPLQSPQD
ncbi:type II secretion system secretin GspD [Luteimonas fraxinea]|uniref:type II secretion system secretin GspD n=1 Tax=Luteimonas fraxinea TaxID=2901869 RepID=UPI001E4395C0|nr:type II secretion system secretin GspD [Luteimonas fraxinea]MCD9124334.1 type II secretion system secretin GspD [Luteimonas fraxinea]